jgi:hypothetical protein
VIVSAKRFPVPAWLLPGFRGRNPNWPGLSNELRPYNKDAVDVIRHDDEFVDFEVAVLSR